MKRRLAAGLLIVGAAALFATGSGAAPGGTKLTPLASVRFPDRAFVLATAKPVALSSANVRVHENGELVNNVSVVPASKAKSGTFGVVLVIDASNSMRGDAIAGAMKAARVFAANKAAGAALGVVTFNRSARVVVPPTTDEQAVTTALASPPALARGTHMYDAVASALDALRAKRIKAGSLVLLTDGRDTGSLLDADAVVAKARAAGVRVFAVGLRSPQFTPSSLRHLSGSTGAAFSEAASAADLPGIYQARSKQLASEYLLRYRSLAGPDAAVRVQVAAAGVPSVGTWSYTTPALPSTPQPPYHRSPVKRFVQSPASVLAISLLAAALIWFAVSTLFRNRPATLRRRIGSFSDLERDATVTKRQVTSPRIWFLESVVPSTERFFQRYSWWDRFEEDLEIAKFPITPVPLVALTAGTTLLAAILLGLVSPLMALFAICVPFIVRSIYKQRVAKQRDRFADQLPDNLTVLAASLRAGHSFVGSLSAVIDEAEEPSREELNRAVSDERLGVPVEDALLRVAARMDSSDLEQVALVAALQRETGGNTAEVLDTVVDSIRERFELRRLVKALTAQGRLSRWILMGLPLAVVILIGFINPSYLRPLFVTTSGQVMLAVSIGLLMIGSYLIKRITEIEI